MHCTCMQTKLTLKVAGGAECRGRHDDLQLADQVLYGLWIASASTQGSTSLRGSFADRCCPAVRALDAQSRCLGLYWFSGRPDLTNATKETVSEVMNRVPSHELWSRPPG